MGLDLLAVNGALLLALVLRPEYRLDWGLLIRHPHWFLLLSALWLPLAHVFDAYNLRVTGRFATSAPAVLKAGAITCAIYLLIPYLSPALPTSRFSLFSFFLFAFFLLLAVRGLYTLSLAQPLFHQRAIILGAGWAGRTIAQALAEHGDGTYQVVGFVDDDSSKQDLTFPGCGSTFHILGDRYTLPHLVNHHQVTTLILAINREVDGEMLQILMDCLELGVKIIPMPVLLEQLTGRVPVEHMDGKWYMAMPIDHPGTGALWPLVKRVMDIILASLGLLLLLPFLPFLALAIYLDSPGPIFYTQERVGEKGKRFKIYKFRTMVPDAEKDGPVWAQKNDRRVTRVGRILRRTHVDEFPQFLNILKGEMSAVGPRPERPEFVETLAAEIPFYRVRHAVKPGMASWGLVNQGYGASKEDALLKLQYDLYYIKHQSLWLDIVILLKAIVNALTLQGR
ncbi:MAG: sugar transferase [Syntrophobacterales bacterium]|nr:sugar transferase [Syntrophobacterales bacterium]